MSDKYEIQDDYEDFDVDIDELHAEKGLTKESGSSDIKDLLELQKATLLEMQTLNKHFLDTSEHNYNREHVRLIDEMVVGSTKQVKVKIFEKDITFTGGNIPFAQDIYYAQKLGLKLRFIKAELNGGSIIFDGNKYRSSTGKLEFSNMNLGAKGLFQGMVRKSGGDSFFFPAMTGYGTVQLNESVNHLLMLRCDKPKRYILENGVYASSVGSFKFTTHFDTKLGDMVFNRKNMMQTAVTGVGALILELPVHPSELERYKVTLDRPLRVNGDNVLYREGNVKRTKTLASGVYRSLASGAGFIEEYTGEGYVVLAPTLNTIGIISKELGDNAFEDSAVKGSKVFKNPFKKAKSDDEYENWLLINNS